MGSVEPGRRSDFSVHTSELAHNGKRRLHPQHSTEVSPQQHDAGHEAFLSLGCASFVGSRCERTWITG